MTMEVRLPTQPFPILTIEKLGLPRVLEILHTCDWTSPTLETDSLGSFQDPELDFELNAFDNEQNDENGSEKDVDYMERMMAMLLHARGNHALFLSRRGLTVDMGQEMGLEERKRLARRTIEKVAEMS